MQGTENRSAFGQTESNFYHWSGQVLYGDLFCSSTYKRIQEKLQPLPAILQAIQEGTPVPVSILLGPHMEER